MNETLATGAVLGSEKDVHLQNYVSLIDFRAVHLVLAPLQATCEVGTSWDKAVDGEVAMSTSIPEAGYAVAGLYPTTFKSFDNKQRKALHFFFGEQYILRTLGCSENVLRVDLNHIF